ncbi:LuxR C-terminal-related transcriptional regulator [Paraburkholderia phytofirmans]|uniref:LuxR C-terminal-related transcriptional regulator n=1 Tax=Paraburkholderia phytofirmans TaxID=261302 RepID=UPI0038BD6000
MPNAASPSPDSLTADCAASASSAHPAVRLGARAAAKIAPPASHTTDIPRDAIRDLVCVPHAAKLVLVRAPAGFGKTTAMSQCRAQLARLGFETAWLTLDHGDNDPSRFLHYLQLALRHMDAERLAGDDPRSAADVTLAVFDRIAARQSPFALFIDEFETIHDPGVIALLHEIVDRLPRHGFVVIGSRSQPHLSLGRLRARGQLLEIDADRLRFSLAETERMLNGHANLALGGRDLDRLQRRTEGWAAALWLASLALEKRDERSAFIERFSGSHDPLADYLAEDVLAGQPEPVQTFLLQCSVLRQLSAPVCDALNPGVDSATMLRTLDQAGLFVNRVEAAEPAYRFHSLFLDFLRAQLARRHPDRVPLLHLAASRWHEQHGHPVSAIDHAIDAGDVERALGLLLPHAVDFLAQGRLRLLARWFARLPQDGIDCHPTIGIVHAWTICLTRSPLEAMALAEQANWRTAPSAEIRAQADACHVVLLATLDRVEEAYEAGRRCLTAASAVHPFANATLVNVMATLATTMGHRDEARRLLDTARTIGGAQSALNRMYTEAAEGLIDLQEGHLRLATARFHLAAGTAGGHETAGFTDGNAWAGLLYARALYEAGRVADAEPLLNIYVPLARDIGLPDHAIAGYSMQARIAFQRGDVDLAFRLLAQLERLGYDRRLPRVVASAKLERARLLLLQGNAEASRSELDLAAGATAVWTRIEALRFLAHEVDSLTIARLRWALHFGDAGDAARALAQARADAASAGRRWRAMKLQLLECLALLQAGREPDALAAAWPLLDTLCAEGLVRMMVDEGPLAARLAMRCQASGATRARDPLLEDYLRACIEPYAAQLAALAEGEPPAHAAAPLEPLEPLTRKERRVLQLLAQGYSNNAMAEKLFVSYSTVCTHLRNINAKLNVHNRTSAVAVGRRFGLID